MYAILMYVSTRREHLLISNHDRYSFSNHHSCRTFINSKKSFCRMYINDHSELLYYYYYHYWYCYYYCFAIACLEHCRNGTDCPQTNNLWPRKSERDSNILVSCYGRNNNLMFLSANKNMIS